MAKNPIKYRYLEAGEKSSPVVVDERLDTHSPDTLYLYNLKRNEILVYNRGIVEAKLRDLRDDEAAVVQELKNAYAKARRGFKYRNEPAPQTTARRHKAAGEKAYAGVTEDAPAPDEEFDTVTDDDWGDDGDD